MAVEKEFFSNIWVLMSGAFVFIMTISFGLLEIDELGEKCAR